MTDGSADCLQSEQATAAWIRISNRHTNYHAPILCTADSNIPTNRLLNQAIH